jgi:hypothetical protein
METENANMISGSALAAPGAFTAAQIAAAVGRTARSVRRQLESTLPASTKIVNGNETVVFTLGNLPGNLRVQIEDAARRANCRNVEALLNAPRQKWEPSLTLDKIADEQVQAATKLREALRPWLVGQHDSNLSRAEIEARGVEDYRRIFGNGITTRYWRELFMRTVRRDNGFEEWNRLEIYLPDRLKQKETPATIIAEALAADFAGLENFIQSCRNPHALNANECAALWTLALEKVSSLTRAGASEKSAGRRLREFLFCRAPFLAQSRPALFMAFKRKLKRWQRGKPETLRDGRAKNGSRANYPSKDIRIVRHSAVLKNGKRIDAAWREEYPNLSEYTKQRHPRTWKCPRAFYRVVNREKVDALFDCLQGKRFLRRRIGGVTRNAEAIPGVSRTIVKRGLVAETSDEPAAQPGTPGRRLIITPELAESGGDMEHQRQEIQKARQQQKIQNRRAQRLMQQTGIYTPESARENIQPEEMEKLSNFLNSDAGTNGPGAAEVK